MGARNSKNSPLDNTNTDSKMNDEDDPKEKRKLSFKRLSIKSNLSKLRRKDGGRGSKKGLEGIFALKSLSKLKKKKPEVEEDRQIDVFELKRQELERLREKQIMVLVEQTHLEFDQVKEIVKKFSNENGACELDKYAFTLTSQGNIREKLEFAFDLYDLDKSGFLDEVELKQVIEAMLLLADTNVNKQASDAIASQCLKAIDENGDGHVSKDEFVKELLDNYWLRSMMCPFN